MSTTALEIQVDANVKNAAAGLATVQNELSKTALAAQKTDSSLGKLGGAFTDLASKGSKSLFILTEKLKELQSASFTEKDLSKVAKYNAAIQATEKEIAQLSNVGKTGFNALGEAVAKTGNPLAQAFGGLRKIAYILPGIGIAGLIGLISGPLIDAFQSWYESATNVSNATKLLQENQKNLDDVLKEASKDAGKQTQDLKILYDAATNVNLSMKDRLTAVNALQQAFPEFFGNIRKEAILNGDAKGAYDDLTRSIIANARAKAALSKIEDLGAQLLDSEIKQQKIATEIQKNIAAQGVAAAKNSKDAELRGLEQFNTDYKGVKLRQQQIDENANNVRLKEEIDFLTKFAGLAGLEKQAIDNLDLKPPRKVKVKKDKTEKEEDPFKIALADLEDNLKDANALVVGQLNLELQNEHDFLEKKKALLERYGKYQGDNNLKIAENEKKIRAETLRFLASQVIPNIKPPDLTDFGKLATQKINPNIAKPAFSKETQEAIDQQLKLQSALQATADIAVKILDPAFQAFFDTLLTGGGNAFQAFGQALINIIKQMAATILKAIALGAIIAAITGSPFNIGKILSGALGGLPHAAGGINNFSGGNILVGENGPEIVTLPRGASVIPNNQIGNGTMQPIVFIASSRISGNDIVTSYQRQSATNSRNG